MKKAVAYFIIAFWLVMAALFARREIIPDLFDQPVRGYASIRAYAQSHAGYRMGIYVRDGSQVGPRVGTTETTYHLKADGTCEISSRAFLDRKYALASLGLASVGGAVRRSIFDLTSDVTIGPDDALRSFRVSCDSPLLTAVATGTVVGDTLRVTVMTADGDRTELPPIIVTKDDIVAIGLTASGFMPGLRVGRTWQLKTIDPLTCRPASATATVTGKTAVQLRGHTYPVFEIETRFSAMKMKSWVAESGDVLMEEAYQIVLIREPLPHEATGDPAEIVATSQPAQN